MPTLPVLDPKTANLALYGTLVGVDNHATTTTAHGTTVVKSVQIFKVGTFKDSWGDQQEWTLTHLNEMASHYQILRQVFPNVPVRTDHTFSVTDVIGYLADIRVEGEFLVADVEFTDTGALEKFSNGTFRSRSIEIGRYETNSGQSYYPVVMGLAFVDIPAVEGLHGRPKNGISTFRQETQVPDAPATPTPPAAPAQLFTFNLAGQPATTDFSAVQAHITKIEGQNATLMAQNTKYEADFAQKAKEARVDFVKALADGNKIVAPQVAPMTTMVEGMSDDQFTQFKAVFEAAPVAGILQPHANAATASNGQPTPSGDVNAPLVGEDLHYAKVAFFRQTPGMTDEKIWATPTGQALRALGKTTLDK
jgi:hypothetical protein